MDSVQYWHFHSDNLYTHLKYEAEILLLVRLPPSEDLLPPNLLPSKLVHSRISRGPLTDVQYIPVTYPATRVPIPGGAGPRSCP